MDGYLGLGNGPRMIELAVRYDVRLRRGCRVRPLDGWLPGLGNGPRMIELAVRDDVRLRHGCRVRPLDGWFLIFSKESLW